MPNPILFFDLETTGKSTTTDRIIELAAIKLDADFNPITDWNVLRFNPGVPIMNSGIHGITDEMVADEVPFSAYAEVLHEYFSNSVLAGYNIKNYDVPLLSEEFGRCNLSWPPLGIVTLDAYKIFALKERRDLTYAVKFYTGNTLEGAHGAKADVTGTIDVLKSQLQMYPDLAAMSPEELQSFCDEGVRNVDLAGKIYLNDQGVACYSFGTKTKGVPVVNDRGFGEWMLKNDFPTNTKNVIRSLIYKS